MMSCLLAGVGGQGTVLASRLLAQAALEMGESARTAETIGMAQRGGCVVSHVRTGDVVLSPLVPLGQADVLIGFDRILRIGRNLQAQGEDVEVIDAQGKFLVPGLIDQHVHICGGGGEGGFHTRTPELNLSRAVEAGVTTLVGLLATKRLP